MITHNLGVVGYIADRIAVMYLGQIVEIGPGERVLRAPAHPYTVGLLSALSEPDPSRAGRRHRLLLPGEIPSPRNPPPACRFHTRCPFATDVCRELAPPLDAIEPDHAVACHHWRRVRESAAASTSAVAVAAQEKTGNLMRVRNDFERRVRTIPNTWITLADGIRLAARIWLPEDAESDPVPAILEYIPYRKDDGTATRDAIMHPWFAGHGYAAVRVDQRGSGDSDGLLLDEYLPQEQDDALEVLAWLAAQPWCTGRIGIIGKSWGGFNGLQIAARRPPELGGVISVCSTDDRYATDVHYMGGCLLGADMLPWASTMLAFNARPPDPAAVGDRWRELWLERLEGTPPFAQTWIAHQRRDAFWKHGSVCEDFDAIEVPVYMVGGWQDAYTDAVFRFLGGYGGPARGLVGPWGHLYPQSGAPGPAIGFLQECLRFWDHCLKDEQNGALDGSALRVYLQEWVDPTAGRHAQRPGRWVAEPSWPPLDSAPLRVLHLRADAALGEQPGEDAELAIAGSQLTGLHSGPWCGWGAPGDDARRPARRGRALALLHLGAPGGAAWRSWASPRRSSRSPPTGRSRSAPCASAMSRPRAPRCSSRAASSTSRTATRTSRPGRSSRDAATRSQCASARSRTPSPLATASAWPSPPPTGRSRGPVPSP